TKAMRQKVVDDVKKNAGQKSHDGHNKSYEDMTPEEVKIYDESISVETKGDRKAESRYTLIYETDNAEGQANTRIEQAKRDAGKKLSDDDRKKNERDVSRIGEAAGKKAAVKAYKDRNP